MGETKTEARERLTDEEFLKMVTEEETFESLAKLFMTSVDRFNDSQLKLRCARSELMAERGKMKTFLQKMGSTVKEVFLDG